MYFPYSEYTGLFIWHITQLLNNYSCPPATVFPLSYRNFKCFEGWAIHLDFYIHIILQSQIAADVVAQADFSCKMSKTKFLMKSKNNEKVHETILQCIAPHPAFWRNIQHHNSRIHQERCKLQHLGVYSLVTESLKPHQWFRSIKAWYLLFQFLISCYSKVEILNNCLHRLNLIWYETVKFQNNAKPHVSSKADNCEAYWQVFLLEMRYFVSIVEKLTQHRVAHNPFEAINTNQQ